MAASQSIVEQSPDTVASEMSERMEANAAAGDWQRVEEIAVRLRSVVMQVPVAKRRTILVAIRRSIDKVQSAAKNAHHDVTGKLSAIRRGQDATKAYNSSTGTLPGLSQPHAHF